MDEVAHFEPPHQDLPCLQIQLLSSLVLKELIPATPVVLLTVNTKIKTAKKFHVSLVSSSLVYPTLQIWWGTTDEGVVGWCNGAG